MCSRYGDFLNELDYWMCSHGSGLITFQVEATCLYQHKHAPINNQLWLSSIFCFPCPEPPSALLDLRVTYITGTTITITWDRPTTTGRSDFFYRVFQSDPNQSGSFILSRNNLVDQGSTVSYQITGLVPFTPYILRVSVHNGVSVDLDRVCGQVSFTTAITLKACKFFSYMPFDDAM